MSFIRNMPAANAGLRLYWATQVFFVFLLVLCVLIYTVAPFSSLHPMRPVWMALSGFLAVFALVSRITLGRGLCTISLDPPSDWVTRVATPKLLLKLVIISSIGLCLHMFAKYSLTHYRPVSCLFEIRFAWLEVPHSVQPWFMRLASILGHLLSALSYFGAFVASIMTVRTHNGAPARWKYLLFLTVFLVIGSVYAGFIGSRNVMLAYLIMAVAGVFFGLFSQPWYWKKSIRLGVASLLLPLIIAAGFSNAVFSNRIYCAAAAAAHEQKAVGPTIAGVQIETTSGYAAAAHGQKAVGSTIARVQTETASSYFLANCRAFAIQCYRHDATDNKMLQILWRDCHICGSTMLYLEHGIMNFAQIVASAESGTPMLFSSLRMLPARFGIDIYVDDKKLSMDSRIYGPGGTTLAGGAYHDYGVAGLIAVAGVLGAIYGCALRLIHRNGAYAPLGVWMFLLIFYVMGTSNLFVGSNVMPFPFIAFGSGITILAIVMRQPKWRGYWLRRLPCGSRHA